MVNLAVIHTAFFFLAIMFTGLAILMHIAVLDARRGCILPTHSWPLQMRINRRGDMVFMAIIFWALVLLEVFS